MRSQYLVPVIFAAAASLPLSAVGSDDVPPPPPLPEEGAYSRVDEGLEPEVTIRKQGEEQVEEYRINGQLYMVKITPSKGMPYYLIDSDGDGSLETRRNSLDDPETVMWRLFTW